MVRPPFNPPSARPTASPRDAHPRHPARAPTVPGHTRGGRACPRRDPARARIPEGGVVAHVRSRGPHRARHHLGERGPGDEAPAPFRRQLLAGHGEELLVVGEHEVAGEGCAPTPGGGTRRRAPRPPPPPPRPPPPARPPRPPRPSRPWW